MNITHSQYELLKSFFNSLWCSYHHNTSFNPVHWANLLDNANISWFIQNTVSALSHKRENNGFYLSTLLRKHNILIEG